MEPDPSGLKGGFDIYAYVGANPLLLIDPLGLLQWHQSWQYTFDAVPGSYQIPYPGSVPRLATQNAGAYTLLNWSVSSICDCTGSRAEFKEFKVDFDANSHIRADLSSEIRSWAVRGEGDHIADAMQWGAHTAKNIAQFMEDNFKGQSFSSVSECQSATSQSLDTALKTSVPLEYDTSIRLWDSSGKHHWDNPNRRP